MMLTHKEVAQKLDGKEYPLDLSSEDMASLRDNGLVVVHPYSDDGMILDGAIDGDIGCFDGGAAYICRDGVIDGVDEDGDIDTPPDTVKHVLSLARSLKASIVVKAIRGRYSDEPCWRYEIPIPHSTFILKNNGEAWAVCAVFSINDLPEMEVVC